MTTNKHTGTAVAAAKEIFEGHVVLEALARAGKCPNLKGHVHEVLVRDHFNLDPSNILSGKKAVLTKSTTAVRDDLIVKQGGKIVERMQLKDTPASISKTLRQVADRKYDGTKLVGTQETTAVYGATRKAAGVTKEMSSSGISSSDTSRIANKVLGDVSKLSAKSLAHAAASAGAVGAAVSGGIEVLASGYKLVNGDINGGEFVANVAKETAGGALSASGGAVAGTVAATATTAALTAFGAATAPAWVPIAAGFGAAVAVGVGIKSVWDAIWE